jgi:hypothetical protein
MSFTIILLPITIAIVVIALRRALVFFISRNKKQRRLSKMGIEAHAVLLHMQQTGLFVNKRPQVRLQLQVESETGWKFVAEAKEVLTFMDLAHLHIGGSLWVKYNPANVKEVMLVRV